MWDVICFLVLHQSCLFWGSVLNLMTSNVIKPFSPPYTACCFQAYRHSPTADLSSHKIPLITLLPSWLSPFALFSLRAHQCCFFLFSAVRSWKTVQIINWPPKQRFLEVWCGVLCAIFGTALFGTALLELLLCLQTGDCIEDSIADRRWLGKPSLDFSRSPCRSQTFCKLRCFCL